jgi:hypothetical protein
MVTWSVAPIRRCDEENAVNRIEFPRQSINGKPVAEQRWAIAWDASPFFSFKAVISRLPKFPCGYT